MNQLKFRIWDKKTFKFLTDSNDDHDDYTHYTIGLNGIVWQSWGSYDDWIIGEVDEAEHDRFVVQQYIGVKDSENTEIYTGDIVRSNAGRDYVENDWEVVFDNCEFYLVDANKDGDKFGTYTRRISSDLVRDGFVVVGHVYDPPAILK